MEIWRIKIECVFDWTLEEESVKICDIQSSCSLDSLCHFILESFEFDNDHLHEFFIARKANRSRRNAIMNELTTLANIFPIEGNNHLFMHFDFGDDWMFEIIKSQKQVKYNKNNSYPRVIEHIGSNPEQYPVCEEYEEQEYFKDI